MLNALLVSPTNDKVITLEFITRRIGDEDGVDGNDRDDDVVDGLDIFSGVKKSCTLRYARNTTFSTPEIYFYA
jgi:hypothetical protein